MSAGLEGWLHRRWYGGVSPGLLLGALALVYAALLKFRSWLYRRGLCRSHRLRVPVIVIGNRVVGGTGKTPLTIALAQHLAAHGWKPGVVSRGYGRRSQEPVRVRSGMSADVCGDEPLLIARRTGMPVAVDTDRVAAAKRLIAEGCTLILADDGLQHLRLGRDIEIEVLDGARGYGNGRLLPAGPLREPLGRNIDFRVINGEASAAVGENTASPMRLRLGDAESLDAGASTPLAVFAGSPVHALAGIGHPARFFSALREHGLQVIEHAFPDHHPYTREELDFLPPAPLLMTEKDAVKCSEYPLTRAWSVPVTAELPDALLQAVRDRLADWSPSATCLPRL